MYPGVRKGIWQQDDVSSSQLTITACFDMTYSSPANVHFKQQVFFKMEN
jgi:hypothetical protein